MDADFKAWRLQMIKESHARVLAKRDEERSEDEAEVVSDILDEFEGSPSGYAESNY
jgi:hypothetical protein